MLPLEFVGKGVYGNVISVLNPTKKNVYALKAITRDKAAAYDLYESLPIERSILLSLDHPMILKLYRTYKDSQRIYFLTEYVNGTDLLDAMRVLGICSD